MPLKIIHRLRLIRWPGVILAALAYVTGSAWALAGIGWELDPAVSVAILGIVAFLLSFALIGLGYERRVLLVVLVALLLGYARTVWTDTMRQNQAERVSGKQGVVTGWVCGELYRSEISVTYLLCLSEFRDQSITLELDQVQATAQQKVEVVWNYGDLVSVNATWAESRPSPKVAASWRLKGILLQAKDAAVYPRIRYGLVNDLTARFAGYQTSLRGMIGRYLPTVPAEFAGGLVVGAGNGGGSTELKQLLKSTGTSHLLAVSGFNVALVTMVIARGVSLWLPRKKRLPVVMLGMLIYWMIVGASASVMRSMLMAYLLLLAVHLGRPTQLIVTMGMALAGIVIISPMALADIGLHYSFLATIGLVWVYPVVRDTVSSLRRAKDQLPGNDRGPWSKVFEFMLDELLIGVSAQSLTIPYTLYLFHALPLISFAANTAVTALIPILTYLVLAALAAGLLVGPLSLPLWLIILGVTELILGILRLSAQLPVPVLTVAPPLWVAGLLYAGLVGGLIYLRKRYQGDVDPLPYY